MNMMMDGRKLDINAPLMSVRRSSAASSPSLTEAKIKKALEKRHTFPNHISDINMDQVTEPVAVPFNWEHIPGMPKDHGESQPQPPKEDSITPIPTLPPGKSTNNPKQPLEKECNDANKLRPSNNSSSLSKTDCDRERKDEKIRSNVEEDDDDVYSDALETLSSTESLSMNCSASGLDTLDANKSGTNTTDKQTQDFMMNRFLPAAKAMTFHPPQYASSRKQSVLAEQPRDVIRLVREERKSVVKKNITDIVPYAGQFREEEVSSDEADEYDNSTNISAKGCGMFHRLRARSSLCLLNPVPGMKMRNQFPMSYAYNEYEKPNKSSHTPAIKKAWDAIHKSKSSYGASSPDMHEARKKWASESKRFTYSGEMKQQGRLSPFRRSSAATTTAAATAATSTFQSKPQPLFPRARLHGDSEKSEKNQSEKLRFQSQGQGIIQDVLSKRSSSSRSLAIEKTLYIDSVRTSRLPPCSNSCSVDKTERVGPMVSVLDKREGKERSSIMITESFQESKNLTDLDSEELATDREDNKDQETNQESMMWLQLVQSSHDKETEINNKQIVAVDQPGKGGCEVVVSHHLPPPLPKSPSDSWLSRALPLVYMKNPLFLHHSNQNTLSLSRRHGFNASSRYTKWETIVKSSNLHHDQLSYSQEITIYKPQRSKS